MNPAASTYIVLGIDIGTAIVENLYIMFDYPFIQNISKLDAMFNKVKTSAIPSKFTVKHWFRLGFTSSQDRGFIDTLKFLDYLDDKGIPTEYYSSLRDGTIFQETLAERIKSAYKEIFYIDTNANSMPQDTIADYMARLINADAKQLYKQAQTFKALCYYADFRKPMEIAHDKKIYEDIVHGDIPHEEAESNWHDYEKRVNALKGDGSNPVSDSVSIAKKAQHKVVFNINLPTTTNPQVYKAIFENLKNLFD